MRDLGSRIATLLLAAGLLGCGGSIKGDGPDGSTAPAPCSSLAACDCWKAADRCQMETTACWCPSECSPTIDCVCGGGQFVACDDLKPATTCDAQVTRVQALCAGQPFASMIGGICSTTGPNGYTNAACIASCLQDLNTVDMCAQIDCSFCTACDCLVPPPSPLRACITACVTPRVPLP